MVSAVIFSLCFLKIMKLSPSSFVAPVLGLGIGLGVGFSTGAVSGVTFGYKLGYGEAAEQHSQATVAQALEGLSGQANLETCLSDNTVLEGQLDVIRHQAASILFDSDAVCEDQLYNTRAVLIGILSPDLFPPSESAPSEGDSMDPGIYFTPIKAPKIY